MEIANSAPLGCDLLVHVAACDECRVMRERALRLAKHWSAHPLAHEVDRLRLRFERRARGGLPRRRAVVFGVVGFVAAATALAGAQKLASDARMVAPHGSVAVPVVAIPAAPAVEPAPIVEAMPALLEPAPAPAPERASASPTSGSEERGARVEEPPTDRRWARAAAAIKNDDIAGAERALADLSTAPDAATRDSARLARAELWLKHGKARQARAVLEDLAAKGASQLVRKRAAELLAPH